MPDFTAVQLTGAFQYADGSTPGLDSFVDFLLTGEMTNSTTGRRVPARTITVPLAVDGTFSVLLYATNDPTTLPLNVLYHVTERIVGTDTGPGPHTPRSYDVLLRYDVSPQNLGLLVPVGTLPAPGYGLINLTVPAPLAVALNAGVANITWDGTGGSIGDAPLITSLSPLTVAWGAAGGGVTGDMHWRDAWDAGTAYVPGDVVTWIEPGADLAAVYVALLASEGDPEDPGHSAHWATVFFPVLPTIADGIGVEVPGLQYLILHGGTLVDDGAGTVEYTPTIPTLGDLGGASAADLATEVSDRQGADTTLSGLITAEASTRAGADSTNATAIAAEASTARAAESANATAISTETTNRTTADSTHAALTTTAHGGIVASTDPRLTDSRTPAVHATTHVTGGSDVIPLAVAGGNAGLFSGANATKLAQFAPTSGKTLTVTNSLTLAGTDGDTATVPSGGGTVALKGLDNAFTVGQGVRGALSGAAGLAVPWVTGDAAPAILGGSSTTGNTQAGVSGVSDSGAGVQGASTSGSGVLGSFNTGGGPQAALEGRYLGSGTGAQNLLVLRNRTSVAGTVNTGGLVVFTAKSDTTADQPQADLVTNWATVTDATRKARLLLRVYDAGGAREALRLEASGSAPLLGFFGHTAAGVPTVTGTQNSNAALASMLSGLAGLGLITDSTTTGTAPAFPNADNVFVKQGIRVAAGTNADGLYVPWVSGDTHATLAAGSATSGNNQIAVVGTSDSAQGLQGTSATSIGVQGVMTGAGTAPVEGRYTGSSLLATPLLSLKNQTSGTPTTGTGGTIIWTCKSDTTTGRGQALLQAVWTTATDASRKAQLSFWAYDTAPREGIRVEASGTAALVGFFGHNASAQQSLAAAATDAATTQTLANSLRTALIAFGLGV